MRAEFKQELEQLNPADCVYVDESGLEESLCREYGRAPRGQKVSGERMGKKAQRLSIIAGLNQKELVAPLHFQGYCDTEVVNTWVENALMPCLKPGQTVIMDNASFHKSTRTKQLIETKGCKLLYLPTYSPDLNPIEQQWAILKARIRKLKTPQQPLEEAIAQVFKEYG